MTETLTGLHAIPGFQAAAHPKAYIPRTVRSFLAFGGGFGRVPSREPAKPQTTDFYRGSWVLVLSTTQSNQAPASSWLEPN
jgi:hypothetical protein